MKDRIIVNGTVYVPLYDLPKHDPEFKKSMEKLGLVFHEIQLQDNREISEKK